MMPCIRCIYMLWSASIVYLEWSLVCACMAVTSIEHCVMRAAVSEGAVGSIFADL
jgi:hypothetical protein